MKNVTLKRQMRNHNANTPNGKSAKMLFANLDRLSVYASHPVVQQCIQLDRNIGQYYHLGKEISVGRLAEVRLATDRRTMEFVAVKIYYRNEINQPKEQRIINEIEAMLAINEAQRQTEEDTVVRFIDLFVSSKYIFIVMELMHMDL